MPRPDPDQTAESMLLDRTHFAGHRRWLVGTSLLALAAAGWAIGYTLRWDDYRWPTGGSLPGLTFGVVGGLIIAFEMLLWPRKYLWRGRRGWPILFFIPLGSTRGWRKLHLWLGLLCLPLLLLHGGFRLDPRGGAALAVVLMWLLIGVVGSGLWGLIQQNRIPRQLYEDIPGETIYAQIGHVLEEYRREARLLVEVTCGPAPEAGSAASFMASAVSPRVAMKPTRAVVAEGGFGAVAGSAPLRTFYEAYARPYLEAPIRRAGRHPLAVAARAAELFRAARAELPVAAHPALDRLAELCDHRRQLDREDRLFRRLHTWLAFHFALSLSLFFLMIAHIVLALRYL